MPHRRSIEIGPVARGFSLVEILVAIAVLCLILVMLSQLSSNTMQITSTSQKQMEATRQARAILDTMRDDLGNLVVQNGAATVFAKTDGLNSKLVFVTYRRGPQGVSDQRFMAVSYALVGTQMVRNYAMISWKDVDLMSKAFQATSSTLSGVIAENILRFEVVMLLDNGNVVPLTTTGSWLVTTWNEDPVPEGFFALRLTGSTVDRTQSKVRALTVAVAALDGKSLLLPNATNILTALIPSDTGKTPLESWNGVINQGGLSAYPRPAAAALRIVQRTFPLQ